MQNPGINNKFMELYERAKREPTPAQRFITEVAVLTRRSEVTVRAWISGTQVPDALVCKTIGEHFGINPERLFPKQPDNR